MTSLSAAAAAALAEFLESPERPEGTLSYHGLQGFLFTLACAPEQVSPYHWMVSLLQRDGRGR